MSVTRCPQGHYFDPAKHTSCPFCGVQAPISGTDAGKTRAIAPEALAPPPALPAASAGKTRALHQEDSGVSPVVGWLVCVDGPDKGRDFRLRADKNFIGRGGNMDVAITGDPAISREKHATILYDTKKAGFWLLPGEASGVVYRNEEIVHSPVQLAADDLIELGSTKLVLTPFLSTRRHWA